MIPKDKRYMVAVLYSPGHGIGWYTEPENSKYEALLFHPKLVNMVETGRQKEITNEWIREELGILDNILLAGAGELEIEWIPEGTVFYIESYDGNERIVTSEFFITA